MNSIGAKKTVDAKRGHLRSPSAKKEQAAALTERPAAGGMLIPGFDVARATDLGKGFVLLQLENPSPGKAEDVAKTAAPAALLNANLPEIPAKDVEALLKELAERGFKKSTRPRLAPKPPPPPRHPIASIPDENRAFMDKLAQQSLADRERLMKNGFLLSSADLRTLRQITRQALSRAVKDGRVFWLDGPSGMQLYPRFFAKPKSERLAFEKVSRALGNVPGASKWQFFSTPKRSLGGISPVEALDKGDMEPVIAAAVAFAER